MCMCVGDSQIVIVVFLCRYFFDGTEASHPNEVKVCRSMNNACWFLAILSYVCFTIWNPLKRLRQRLTILSKKATARCCFKESGSEWKERSSNLSWRRSCRHLVIGEPPPCKQQTRTKEEGGLSKLWEEGSLSEGARTQRACQVFGLASSGCNYSV